MRRWGLVFICTMLVLSIVALPAQKTSASPNDVIFYSPHQDDELLSMGVAILTHIKAGYDVRVVLLTNGEASNAREVINGNRYCSWHQRYHNPAAEGYQPLSKTEFGQARTREFRRAVQALGIPANRIHVHNYDDGTLTTGQMATLVRWQYENNYPNAKHKTMTYHDDHDDHRNAGRALLNMYRNGEISDVRFYIKRTQRDQIPGSYHQVTSDMYPYIQAAAQSYMTWNPKNGDFAIGYHSVPNSFDDLLVSPKSKWHKPNQ